MKATSFLMDDPGLTGALTKVTRALVFNPLRGGVRTQPAKPKAPAAGLLDRLDHWFWRQEQRQREAYLAQASDIYDLERRMRHLERFGGNGFA